MWSTLLSIFITFLGALAFVKDKDILKSFYWASAHVRNTTSDETFSVYVGLRSLLYVQEPCDVFGCTYVSLDFEEEWPTGFLVENFSECKDLLKSELFGTLLTFFTLGFALIGAANRMR